MPVRKAGGGGKKRRGGILGALSRLPGDLARNTEEIITGMPTGAAVSFEAIDKALPKSPLSYFTDIDKGQKKWGDRKDAKALAIATAMAMKEDLRHPLRNPMNTFLTAAAIPSLGAGAGVRGAAALSAASKASKGAKASAAVKAARRKPMRTREIQGIRDPHKVLGDRYKIKLGKVNGKQVFDVIEKKPARSGPKRYMEDTSFSPVARLARVPIDIAHKRSIKKASDQIANPKFKPDAKIVIHGSKEYEKITRGSRTAVGSANKLREAGVGGVKRKNGNVMVIDKTQLAKQRGGGYARMQERRIKEKRKRYTSQILSEPPKPRDKSVAENVLRAPMDLLKTNMYLSGRYAIQNNISTALMNLLGGAGPRHVNTVRKIRKNDPATYERMKGAMGQTATGTYAQGSGTGPLGRFTRKLGEIMSHPEGVQRTAMLARIAEDMDIDPPTLARLLENPNNNRAQVLLQRANERVGDLSRYGGQSGFGKMEQGFVNSGFPIFYPMTKAFTRYTAKTPLMYPAKSALLAQLGMTGSVAQKQGFAGREDAEMQPYYGYYIPSNPGKSLNPQNISPYSPGGDILRQAHNMFPGQHEDLPYLNLLNNLGPMPEILNAAASGRELTSGFDVKDLEGKGSLRGALEESLSHLLPFNEFYLPRESKAHGSLSIKDKLAMRALGPGLWERPTDYKAIVKPRNKKRRR